MAIFYGGLLGAITGALVLCAMFACADDANDDSDGGLTIDEAVELVCWREANAFGWCVRASLPPVAVRSVFVRAGVPGRVSAQHQARANIPRSVLRGAGVLNAMMR